MQPQLYWYIHQLAFRLEKRIDDVLRKQLSIGFAQYKVLEAVGNNAQTKQNMVADMLHQTEASISRQVKILSGLDLLIVGTVMENKRARELTLTEKGEKMLLEGAGFIQEVQSAFFGKLNIEEQAALQQLIMRLQED